MVVVIVTVFMLPVRTLATPITILHDFPAARGVDFPQLPFGDEGQFSISTLKAGTVESNFEFTAASLGNESVAALASTSLRSDSTELPDERPLGTKVPEPASLMLVGSGLLVVARASRMKPPSRTMSRATLVVMECAVCRKILARQAA